MRGDFLVLTLFVEPKIGLFENITFRPQMYLNLFETLSSPKVYNDRKIYHPNIDFFSGQILIPEIINWNPSWPLSKSLTRIKYTIIEPNPETIPNNEWNKNAAIIYHLSRYMRI